MDEYNLILLAFPIAALMAAWFASHGIKKGAAEIDRRRYELHVLKERESQRTSPPVQSSAPMRPMPPA